MADNLPVTIGGITYSGLVIANPGSGGGGGGGGAATIANGADVAEGNTADTPYAAADGSAAGTIVALLKGNYVRSVPLGLLNDTAATNSTGSWSVVALLKGLYALLSGTLTFRRAQNTVTQATQALTANTPATIIPAGTYNGARILNWTASPVYVTPGVTGTPASGAPSDYIPAAASGVPGQYEPPFAPNSGMQAVGASAGNLTVELF